MNEIYILEEKYNTETLIISFSGYLENDIPPFMFIETLKHIKIKKIFVRDPNKAWYLKGILEYGYNVISFFSFLKKYCFLNNIKNIILIGASMGGYASLLYGKLLSTYFNTLTITFSPQTNLTKTFNIENEPTDWMNDKLNKNVWPFLTDCDNKFLNIQKVLQWKSYKYNKNIAFCSSGRELDVKYLDNIKDYCEIEMFNAGDEHNIASWLKNKKILINIIDINIKDFLKEKVY